MSFARDARVTYIGDLMHAAPPVLVGMEGKVHGTIDSAIGEGLYWVNVEVNENTIRVQLHEAQLRPREED